MNTRQRLCLLGLILLLVAVLFPPWLGLEYPQASDVARGLQPIHHLGWTWIGSKPPVDSRIQDYFINVPLLALECLTVGAFVFLVLNARWPQKPAFGPRP